MIKQQNTTDTVNKFQPQGKMKTIKGSVLCPENAGLRLVLNIVNMSGTVDSPLYKVFDKKWKSAKEFAKGWYNTRTGAYKLGALNTNAVQSDTWIVHMLCQTENSVIDMEALAECLKKVRELAKYEKATVHVPYVLVQAIPQFTDILKEAFIKHGISVYVYEEAR